MEWVSRKSTVDKDKDHKQYEHITLCVKTINSILIFT